MPDPNDACTVVMWTQLGAPDCGLPRAAHCTHQTDHRYDSHGYTVCWPLGHEFREDANA